MINKYVLMEGGLSFEDQLKEIIMSGKGKSQFHGMMVVVNILKNVMWKDNCRTSLVVQSACQCRDTCSMPGLNPTCCRATTPMCHNY